MRRPRHLLLYGPPAAGKRTIANLIAQMTNVSVVDNHMTGDIGLRLFARGSREIDELVGALRLEIARAAARNRIEMVSTLMFNPTSDLSLYRSLTLRYRGGERRLGDRSALGT